MRHNKENQMGAALAFLLTPGDVLFPQASTNPADSVGLAGAWTNFALRQSFWCNCTQKFDRVIWQEPGGGHGLMCSNCRGIVSTTEER